MKNIFPQSIPSPTPGHQSENARFRRGYTDVCRGDAGGGKFGGDANRSQSADEQSGEVFQTVEERGFDVEVSLK